MNYKNTLALLPALILAACGGDEQTMNQPALPGSLIYSFPADGQAEVSPKAKPVLRFANALTEDEATLAGKILINGQANQASVTLVDGGRSLELTPNAGLSLGTDYTIEFAAPLLAEGNREIATPNAFGPAGIQFSTRGGLSGIAGLDNTSDTFAVAKMIPSADGFFQPMDFSTFRLRLTQPVHPQWQTLGGAITLVDSAGETVPATILVKGRYITVDPCTVDDPASCGLQQDALTPGETYTLRISSLPALGGDSLDFSAAFTPRETSPTVTLFQETIDSGLLAGTEPQRSVLNGQIINGVTLNSVLQGVAGPSQQTGGLYAELAYAPSFPGDQPVPLRVPKGSELLSSSLDVKVNGFVPIIDPATNSIQQTGEIKVTMLSDATGYLYPNPYSESAEAPRHVKLFMDVSMNTAEAQPNASLSQDLLGVELSGIAIVKNGVLTIDAIGVVEPNLLGQEFTDSTIAFRIEADTNADVQLDALDNRPLDTTGPQLVSWMPGPDDAIPGNRDQMQRPGDPIVLNFDEPLDGKTLAGGLTLLADNNPVAAENLRTRLDGTAVVINPVGGLQHGVAYALQIGSTLTDLAGNGATSQTLAFALPAITDATNPEVVSPLALTTYPGYPCTTTAVDLANKTHGRCQDAAANGPQGQILPITTLPEDRPIVVVFSQSMNLDSIRAGETFVVEQVNPDGSVAGAVSGRLEKNNQRIRFYPDQPWQVGSFYRYTMRSATNASQCSQSPSQAICSAKGFPLQTDLLVDTSAAGVGGPDMTIYFEGAEAATTVFTPLRNLPIRDTNANYVIDCDGSATCLEPFNHEEDPANPGEFLPSANAAKLEVTGNATLLGAESLGANVGCAPGADCPENKFIYQTYALNTEIMGPALNEAGEQIGVRVLLYPTMLATTSASVFLDLLGEQATGPQVLRMTYGEPTEDNPMGLVEGIIVEGEDGQPTFMTTANLTLDAPNLALPDGGTVLQHNLYSYPITLELKGPIVFFDDGRMQVVQRNTNAPSINVLVSSSNVLLEPVLDLASCFGGLLSFDLTACEALVSGDSSDVSTVAIPLAIPADGVYLNFLSNPIKEIPAQY